MDFTTISFNHKTTAHTRFNDIDMLGHVNNSVYGNFFDGGRFDYFRDVVKVNKFTNELWIVLATISVDYVRPIFLDDRLILESKIVRLGSKSMDMLQQILVIDNGVRHVATMSTSTLVCYNLWEKKSVPMPDEWKRHIRMFEKDVFGGM